MNLFYASPDQIQGATIEIEGQEAIHISKVLRHSVGEKIMVTDGMGHRYRCNILEIKRKKVYLDVLNSEFFPKTIPDLTLCMGIIKKRDRLEFAVEKATELGVSTVVLFEGEHSQKGSVRRDRLENTAISAMKQSLRYHLPKLFVEKDISDSIDRHAQSKTIILADETIEDTDPVSNLNSESYFLIVGPEGGFSSNEREIVNKFKPIIYSLGKHRLRAETAAVVMVDRFSSLQ